MGARPAGEHRRRRPGVERNPQRKGIDLVDGNGRHFTPSLPLMCGGAIVADMTRRVTPFIAMLPCLLAATPTLAHTGDVVGGFVGGLAHPVLGPDHVAAMVAVGLWGAFLGPPAIFLLPVVFPAGDGVRRRARHSGRAIARHGDRHRDFGGAAGSRGGVRGAAADLDRRRAGRRVRDLPRPCPWRGIAGGRGRAGLQRRLRGGDRAAASRRHRARPAGALARRAAWRCAAPAG